MEARWLVGLLLTASCVATLGYAYGEGYTSALCARVCKWGAGDRASRRRRQRAGRAEGVKQGVLGCIGGTPLVRLKSLCEATGCEVRHTVNVAFP